MLRVLWFRKDLRLEDNKTLRSLLNDFEKGDSFCFVYIKNYNSYKFFGSKRIRFLLEALEDLRNDLRSKEFTLNIFTGSSIEFFNMLTKSWQGDITVYACRQVEPYCVVRDIKVSTILNRDNSKLKLIDDLTLLPAGSVRKDDEKPYTVFTPFSKKFLINIDSSDFKKMDTDFEKLKNGHEFRSECTFDLKAELNKLEPNEYFTGGRKAGLQQLKDFYEKKLSEYGMTRDFPASGGTSKLSPHLHFGTVSIREVYRTAIVKLNSVHNEKTKEQVKTWLNELIWREFYYNITFFFPEIDKQSFKKVYDKVNWSYDKKHFELWCKGKTGYPIVDAGMRQLKQTGWIHNRLRMITAMFLTKHLLIDWRWGEKYFAENLIDLDFSSNNGGWQWSASTGCDAQPYFRIFNPVLQSKKFDKDGKFIKMFVPELKNVPSKYIHAPWEMDNVVAKRLKFKIGKDYPLPVVDHKTVRNIAIKEFKSVERN